jgi:hypothetical protein
MYCTFCLVFGVIVLLLCCAIGGSRKLITTIVFLNCAPQDAAHQCPAVQTCVDATNRCMVPKTDICGLAEKVLSSIQDDPVLLHAALNLSRSKYPCDTAKNDSSFGWKGSDICSASSDLQNLELAMSGPPPSGVMLVGAACSVDPTKPSPTLVKNVEHSSGPDGRASNDNQFLDEDSVPRVPLMPLAADKNISASVQPMWVQCAIRPDLVFCECEDKRKNKHKNKYKLERMAKNNRRLKHSPSESCKDSSCTLDVKNDPKNIGECCTPSVWKLGMGADVAAEKNNNLATHRLQQCEKNNTLATHRLEQCPARLANRACRVAKYRHTCRRSALNRPIDAQCTAVKSLNESVDLKCWSGGVGVHSVVVASACPVEPERYVFHSLVKEISPVASKQTYKIPSSILRTKPVVTSNVTGMRVRKSVSRDWKQVSQDWNQLKVARKFGNAVSYPLMGRKRAAQSPMQCIANSSYHFHGTLHQRKYAKRQSARSSASIFPDSADFSGGNASLQDDLALLSRRDAYSFSSIVPAVVEIPNQEGIGVSANPRAQASILLSIQYDPSSDGIYEPSLPGTTKELLEAGRRFVEYARWLGTFKEYIIARANAISKFLCGHPWIGLRRVRRLRARRIAFEGGLRRVELLISALEFVLNSELAQFWMLFFNDHAIKAATQYLVRFRDWLKRWLPAYNNKKQATYSPRNVRSAADHDCHEQMSYYNEPAAYLGAIVRVIHFCLEVISSVSMGAERMYYMMNLVWLRISPNPLPGLRRVRVLMERWRANRNQVDRQGTRLCLAVLLILGVAYLFVSLLVQPHSFAVAESCTNWGYALAQLGFPDWGLQLWASGCECLAVGQAGLVQLVVTAVVTVLRLDYAEYCRQKFL